MNVTSKFGEQSKGNEKKLYYFQIQTYDEMNFNEFVFCNIFKRKQNTQQRVCQPLMTNKNLIKITN